MITIQKDFSISDDLSDYKGKYVAIVDKKIVFSGRNAKKVLDEAKSKYPSKRVVLRKIPEEEALILV